MNLNEIEKTLRVKGLSNEVYVLYEPATLKEWPTGWQIEYRILNPDSKILEKKRLRFEKIRKRLGNDAKARKHSKLYCEAINQKLASGWNPYSDTKNAKTFHKLTDALNVFIKEKELDMKNGVFRYDSMRSYRSHVEMFCTWLKQNNNTNINIASFTKRIGQAYLDYVYQDKQLSARTWNNYLTFLRRVWNWLIEKNYCSENIFTTIKPKPKLTKERTIISESWNNKIMGYFREHHPEMELVCGLVYNSFMRPQEICRTQIKDIQLDRNGIYLTGNKTKNTQPRWCLLPPHLLEILKDKKIERYSMDHYLISTGLRPGKQLICTRVINKVWDKMRKAIKLPMEMKLYSYRDTGITDMKKEGFSNLFISSITGHKNSEEIETYTHEPDIHALSYMMEKSRQL